MNSINYEIHSDIDQFQDAGLHPIMSENISLCRYDVPTPIQAYAIPAVLTGHDLIAIAQTGKLESAGSQPCYHLT